MFFRDVLPQNFDSYSSEVQKLICTADHLGALMQYDTPGFLPNRRIHRGTTDTFWGCTDDLNCNITSKGFFFFSAMGLATLEVMQAMHRTWSNSKVRVNGKTRQMQWRDMFDIAVKWRRWGIVEKLEHPFLSWIIPLHKYKDFYIREGGWARHKSSTWGLQIFHRCFGV